MALVRLVQRYQHHCDAVHLGAQRPGRTGWHVRGKSGGLLSPGPPYVECDPKGAGAGPDLCARPAIRRYPTRIIWGEGHEGCSRFTNWPRHHGSPVPGRGDWPETLAPLLGWSRPTVERTRPGRRF